MPNTHAQFSENDDVIRAISEGQVDAFVISGSDEPQVVTLSTADLPYRLLTDRMLQGAVTVAADATILYANKPFARLVAMEAEHLPGTTLKQMVLPDDVPLLEAILARADAEPVDAELTLVRDCVNVPVRIEADKPFAATGAVCLVVTDLSELRLHEAVVAAEALGRSILDQAVDAIVVCDARDDVIRASKSSHLLCDCNPLLQPFEAVFPLFRLGDTLDLDAVRRGHVLRNASFEMRRAGVTTSLLVSAGPVIDRAGNSVGAVITMTDVSELKRVEGELKEADARKDEMLAVVVHELRSPLSTISLALELLQSKGGVPQDPSHVHDALKRSVEHIRRLVEDLADFNRIRLHKLSLSVSAIDLRAVVRHAVEDCLALANSRSQRIIFAGADFSVMVKGDETRLAQVFINLIHNATKFTQPGGEIRISVARDPTHAVVVVSDDGIGIEASMLERVFHAFEQVSGAEKRGGLGVGLTLARRIVELHGGTISASSDGPGAGSAFTVRLPFDPECGRRRHRSD